MAKTRAKMAIVRSFQSAPAPVIRIASAPPTRRRRAASAPVIHRKKSHRRVGGGSAVALTPKHLFGVGIGGLALGYIEKHWGASLPTMPVIGRKGTIALTAYFLNKHGGMGSGIARDIAIAAAALAGYDLGNKGSISGDLDGDVDGEVAPQIGHRVRGVSAQI